MIKRFLIVFGFFCVAAHGANDFSGDGNCKALWRFENGALTADSKGTNTLTAVNTPVADTVNFKEGAASVDLENSETDYFSITDAALDAGFPLKNGDANKKISLAFWCKIESLPTSSYYWVIYDKGVGTNVRSFMISIYPTTFSIQIGYNGGANWEVINHGTQPQTARWYHVGVTFQDSDKAYKIRIWDDTAGALLGGAEVTGTSTNNINVEDGALTIGFSTAAYSFDGLLDEIVVFDDILTSAEIDQIRSGTYGAAVGGGGQVIIIE